MSRASSSLSNITVAGRVHQEAQVSFELLEASTDWTESDRFWSEVQASTEGVSARPTQLLLKKNPYELKIAKLRKADSMIENELAGGDEAQKKQSALQAEALEIQNKMPVDGARLNSVFAKIKAEKRKSEILARRKGALLAEVAELEMKAADGSQNPEPMQVRKSSEPSGRENGFKGLRIQVEAPWEFWVGRNAQQNDELLRRASSEDTWLHLRDYPGAHGLLRGPKKQEPPLGLVQFAARVVAGFSAKRGKPWATGEKLDFFVVKRKFLKKKRGAAPGEVVVDRETVRTVAYQEEKFQILTS
jgi:predicted ribosome quality control (RQC) complex YloA/Tae2 family protein